MNTRRAFLKTSAAVSLSLVMQNIFSSCQKTEDKPNILWITSEDNSPLLGCYGDELATTPNLDRLADEGVLFTHAFATAPVCAPARNSIITGMFPPSLGTQHMRSTNAIPDAVQFFPIYLRKAGYYCTNNVKKDYNTIDQPDSWDESSRTASYKNRAPGQPFFAIFNIKVSHESSLHKRESVVRHDPEKVSLPDYHPDTPEIRADWAQYYDKVEEMDCGVGEILKELEEQELSESTIVFYYADHGGVVCRSKRFCYDSGLRVPFIVRFPDRYQHFAPCKPGTQTDRIVSFVDLAPTLLSLTGVEIPDYLQGSPFLGKKRVKPSNYAYSFRGRMDERFDFCRSVRDKQFRYIRNYMPHRIYGQHLEYLWKAAATRSWEAAYLEGRCNAAQSQFWNTKPVEELYDLKNDSSEVNNVANHPDYQDKCAELRSACFEWQKRIRDTGFIPESQLAEIASTKPVWEFAQSDEYQLDAIMRAANEAIAGDAENIENLQKNLQNRDTSIRYWAAVGCVILGEMAAPALKDLQQCLKDDSAVVRITAAEAIYRMGDVDNAIRVLIQALENGNDMTVLQTVNVLDYLEDYRKEVIWALQKLISHRSNYVQRVVRYILDKKIPSEVRRI